jgi:hypothetical protein
VARYLELRAAGRLSGAVSVFPDCPAEAWRKVETDPEGRVVRYARHGEAGGAPFEVELYYDEDGALGVARYRAGGGPAREVRLGGAARGDARGIPPGALVPRGAADAAIDAPPRCRL